MWLSRTKLTVLSQVVAKVYAKLMEEFKGAFDLVEFAVFYWGNEITNYQAFKDSLG